MNVSHCLVRVRRVFASGFAVLALDHDKPLLGPLYAWSASIQKRGAKPALIPWAIRLWLEWIARKYRAGGRLQQVELLTGDIGELFRTDAKAEGGRATVGGWETRHGLDTAKARWFFLEIVEADFPWAFSKDGNPQRFIAALELLGSLLAIHLFSDEWLVRPSEGSQRRASRTTGEMRTRPRRCCLQSGRWRFCCWS